MRGESSGRSPLINPGRKRESPAPRARDAWAYLAWCPNCSQRLELRHCKARCFRCGFFQDCGDTIV